MQRGEYYATRVLGHAQSYAVAQILHSGATSSGTWLHDLPLSLVFGQTVGLEKLCDANHKVRVRWLWIHFFLILRLCTQVNH